MIKGRRIFINCNEKNTKSTLSSIEKVKSNLKFYQVTTKIKKRKRCCKKDIKHSNFKCEDCSKSYLSFPALYTHRRNKHNIIPITGKQNIFKSFQFRMMSNFSYSSFAKSTELKKIIDPLSDEMKKVLKSFYLDPSCILFNKNFKVESYPILLHLEYFKNLNTELKIPKSNENISIDRMLSLYLLLLCEVTRENFFSSLSIKMVLLLRQYLNIVGWDNLKSYHDLNVYTHDFKEVGEYTENNNPEEIPGLINDFVAIFINLDSSFFGVDLKNFLDIVHNFCQWLFINEFTNHKLVYIEEYKNNENEIYL